MRLLLTLISLLLFQFSYAQIVINPGATDYLSKLKNQPEGNIIIRGKVVSIDSETKDTIPVAKASVRLLALPDSVQIGEAITFDDGFFSIWKRVEPFYKDFVLKTSSIGLKDTTIVFSHKIPTMRTDPKNFMKAKEMGTIVLNEKELSLEELKVVGELKKMFIRGDTIIYNTDAFKMPSGSVLVELVRRLPGIHFDQNGRMMYGNKPISEIRLNGESFFRGNMNIALFNMPTEELEQLKVYDASTAEDSLHGNTALKQTVMDMKTKRKVSKTIFANLISGSTNKWGKYLVNGDVSIHRSAKSEYMMSAGISSMPSNVSTAQATGIEMRKQTPDTNNSTKKNVTITMKEDLGKNWGINSAFSHNHNNTGKETPTAREQFLSDYSIYNLDNKREAQSGNINNGKLSISKSFKDFSLSISGNVSHATSSSTSRSTSMTFTENPFRNEMSTDFSDLDMSHLKNKNIRESSSTTDGKSAGVTVSLTQAMKSFTGSFLSGSASFSIDENDNQSFSENNVSIYKEGQLGSQTLSNQMLINPTKNFRFSTELSHRYSKKDIQIKTHYKFEYNKRNNERSVFQFDQAPISLAEWSTTGAGCKEDQSLYRDSRTTNQNHSIGTTFGIDKMENKGWRYSLGAEFSPKHVNANTAFKTQEALDKSYNFQNWSVNTDFAKKISDFNIGFSYHANSSSPDIYQLLPITDNSNPLFVTKGNPDLHNRLAHSFNLSLMRKLLHADISYKNNAKEIVEKTTYNTETGVQERMLVNMKGGWSWSTSIGNTFKYREFSASGNLVYNYSVNPRLVSYGAEDIISNTRNNTFNASLILRYGNEKWDINTNASAFWIHNKSDIADERQSPSVSTYNLNITIKRYFGAHWDACAGYYNTWRHGSTLSTANGSDGCLNLNARYRFLKGRASLTLNAFDVLNTKKNVTFYATQTGNMMYSNNCMNRYVLLTFAYKINKLW